MTTSPPTVHVTVLHNTTRDDLFRAYRPLTSVMEPVFELDVPLDQWGPDIERIARMVFTLGNVDPEMVADAPGSDALLDAIAAYRARRVRSISVGDVIVIGEVVLAVDRIGFTVQTAPVKLLGSEPGPNYNR